MTRKSKAQASQIYLRSKSSCHEQSACYETSRGKAGIHAFLTESARDVKPLQPGLQKEKVGELHERVLSEHQSSVQHAML